MGTVPICRPREKWAILPRHENGACPHFSSGSDSGGRHVAALRADLEPDSRILRGGSPNFFDTAFVAFHPSAGEMSFASDEAVKVDGA